jgi:hypothetical protein
MSSARVVLGVTTVKPMFNSATEAVVGATVVGFVTAVVFGVPYAYLWGGGERDVVAGAVVGLGSIVVCTVILGLVLWPRRRLHPPRHGAPSQEWTTGRLFLRRLSAENRRIHASFGASLLCGYGLYATAAVWNAVSDGRHVVYRRIWAYLALGVGGSLFFPASLFIYLCIRYYLRRRTIRSDRGER